MIVNSVRCQKLFYAAYLHSENVSCNVTLLPRDSHDKSKRDKGLADEPVEGDELVAKEAEEEGDQGI